MPADGRLVCLDVSKEFTDKARGYWKQGGVAEKIDLRLGPGLVALDKMIASGEGPFDLAFIDADKPNYDGYYERVLKLLRPGGLIALDNMLWSGTVADPSRPTPTPRPCALSIRRSMPTPAWTWRWPPSAMA